MYKETTYRNIAYFSGLLLIIGLFVTVAYPVKPGIIDLIYGFTALTTITSSFLWLKRKLIFIGLLFYIISFNIDLLLNPVSSPGLGFQLKFLYWPGAISSGIGVALLILGLWNKINDKPWSTLEVKLHVVLLILVLTSGLIQTIFRIM